MKKIALVSLLFVFFAHIVHAQRVYSKTNLAQASLKELNIYLKQSETLKKTGKTMFWAGTASCIASTLLIYKDRGETGLSTISALTLVAGVSVALVGLPIYFSAAMRINKINEIKETVNHTIQFELIPIGQYNYITHNCQPGLSLRIRF